MRKWHRNATVEMHRWAQHETPRSLGLLARVVLPLLAHVGTTAYGQQSPESLIPPVLTATDSHNSREAFTLHNVAIDRIEDSRRIVAFSRTAHLSIGIGDWVLFTWEPVAATQPAPTTQSDADGSTSDAKSVASQPSDALGHGEGLFAVGRIFAFDAAHAAAKLEPGGATPPLNATGVLIRRGLAAHLRARLPEGTTLWGKLRAVSESHSTVWIEGGAAQGFRVGDRLNVEREGLPIGRVELTEVSDESSVGRADPLVSNVGIRAEDTVRLWPSPSEAASGKLQTRVLAVMERKESSHAGPLPQKERPSGGEIWIAANQDDGAAVGQQWEIHRADEYVDLLTVYALRGHFAIARPSEAFARDAVHVGDVAKHRLSSDVLSGRMPLRAFRQEDGYCLINGGEMDGILPGMRLSALPPSGERVPLEVSTAKVDYSGASIIRPTPATMPGEPATRPAAAPAILWAPVVPEGTGVAQPPAGSVQAILGGGAFAVVSLLVDRSELRMGQAVRIGESSGAAGLLVHLDRGVCVVHVPPGCAAGEIDLDMSVYLSEGR